MGGAGQAAALLQPTSGTPPASPPSCVTTSYIQLQYDPLHFTLTAKNVYIFLNLKGKDTERHTSHSSPEASSLINVSHKDDRGTAAGAVSC